MTTPRRAAADYAQGFAALLPSGPAWPRDRDSALMGYVAGQAEIWEMVDRRAADLVDVEGDPRFIVELLGEWERAFGLPDPCLDEPLTVADRRRMLLNRMTTEGGQSRAFFIGVAAALGYTVTIRERSPFQCGISRVGDTRDDDGFYRWEIAPPEIRYVWMVRVGGVRLSWFRVGSGQVGVDPHLRIALATDLECILRRWKPAHSNLVFDYSGLTAGGEFAGTP